MATKIYKLNPNLWPKNRNKIIRVNATIWAGSLLGGVLIANPRLLSKPVEAGHVAVVMMPFLVLVSVVFAFSMMRKIKQARLRYDSYELRLDEDRIERYQATMPSLALQRSEVIGVQAVEGKGFMVKTADHMRFLYIPDELIGYESVCGWLSGWAPQEMSTGLMPFMFRPYVGMVITVGSIMTIYLGANRYLVTVTATLFVAFMVYTALYTLRSPHSTPQAQRAIWTFALCTVVVVFKVLAVWR